MSRVAREVLQAARIAAGFMVVADAADEMEIPRYVLLRGEAGTTPLMPKYVPVVAKIYGVTEEFLKSGAAPKGRIEELSAVLVSVFETTGSSSGDLPAGAQERLKTMRMAAGYATAKAAAEALGWKAATYAAHENGGRVLSVERIVGYSLAFGIRPEFAVFGRGEMFMPANQSFDWWSHRRGAIAGNNPAPSWTWLNKSVAAGRRSFPLLKIEKGEAELLKDGMVSLPLAAVPDNTSEGSLYGVLHKVGKNIRILVLDPRSSTGEVVAIRAGGVQIEPAKTAVYEPINPLRGGNLGDGTILGSIIFAMDIRAVI